jgi:hypothetical protein
LTKGPYLKLDKIIAPKMGLSLAMSYSHRGKPPTTIGAEELNFRVRNGNGCDLFAIITRLWFEVLFLQN